jgi:two-component system, NarL family, response regulator DevR
LRCALLPIQASAPARHAPEDDSDEEEECPSSLPSPAFSSLANWMAGPGRNGYWSSMTILPSVRVCGSCWTTQADFEVVAAVASAEEALLVAEEEPIDVAVVDYQLDGRNGLWVSRKLKRLPRPPAVLIYSAYTDGVVSSAAVIAEADGIVSKGGLGSDLCAAIRRVARGHHLLAPVPPWLGEVLRQRLDHEEQAIFGLLLAGIGPAEIADTLGLSEAELESRLWVMLRKVETSDSARHGWRAAGAAARGQ